MKQHKGVVSYTIDGPAGVQLGLSQGGVVLLLAGPRLAMFQEERLANAPATLQDSYARQLLRGQARISGSDEPKDVWVASSEQRWNPKTGVGKREALASQMQLQMKRKSQRTAVAKLWLAKGGIEAFVLPNAERRLVLAATAEEMAEVLRWAPDGAVTLWELALQRHAKKSGNPDDSVWNRWQDARLHHVLDRDLAAAPRARSCRL